MRALRPTRRDLVLALLAVVPLLPLAGGALVGDSWMVLARNLDGRLSEVPGWFLTVRHDWYRPLFELLALTAWRSFGLQALGYRLLTLALYALTAVGVGRLGEALSGRARVGWLAGVLFAWQHFHAEPALWFAAASDLLLVLLGLVTIGGYLRYRRTGGRPWYAGSVVAFLLALGAKETAVVLPLAVVLLDVLGLAGAASDSAGRPSDGEGETSDRGGRVVVGAEGVVWSRLWWWGPYALVGGLFLVWRVAVGNPYPFAVTPGLLLRNVGHYAVLLLLAAPIDHDLTVWPPGAWWPVVTTVASGVAGIGLVMLGGGLVGRPSFPRSPAPGSQERRMSGAGAARAGPDAWGGGRGVDGNRRDLDGLGPFGRLPWLWLDRRGRTVIFGSALTALALLPVLPIVAERTALLPSVGVALAFGALVAWLLDGARRVPGLAHDRRMSDDSLFGMGGSVGRWGRGWTAAVLLAAGLYLGAQLGALVHRGRWWHAAATTSAAVYADLEAELPLLPAERPVCLVGVPDNLGFAWAFRNALPHAGRVRGYERPVRMVLDVELTGRDAAARAAVVARGCGDDAVRLWYADGELRDAPP